MAEEAPCSSRSAPTALRLPRPFPAVPPSRALSACARVSGTRVASASPSPTHHPRSPPTCTGCACPPPPPGLDSRCSRRAPRPDAGTGAHACSEALKQRGPAGSARQVLPPGACEGGEERKAGRWGAGCLALSTGPQPTWGRGGGWGISCLWSRRAGRRDLGSPAARSPKLPASRRLSADGCQRQPSEWLGKQVPPPGGDFGGSDSRCGRRRATDDCRCAGARLLSHGVGDTPFDWNSPRWRTPRRWATMRSGADRRT